MQSRTIVLDARPLSVEDLPCAEIDGSSYGHAPAESCEVYLQPRRIFPDPFRGGDHILVLCDTYVPPLVRPRSDHHQLVAASASRPGCACVSIHMLSRTCKSVSPHPPWLLALAPAPSMLSTPPAAALPAACSWTFRRRCTT